MTLGERIRRYRGREGLSQEALAERVGVSRQAVSKWETDAAMPELDKLAALARALGVTADQLLNGDVSTEEEPAAQPPAEDRPDHAAGWLSRLLRRWGWLSGVYLMLCGLWIALIGALAYGRFKRILFPMDFLEDDPYLLSLGPSYTFPMTVAKIVIVMGIAAAAAGVVLAIYLRRKR